MSSTYELNTITLKVEHNDSRILGDFRRITGFVKVVNLIPLITTLDLDANPRNSRKSDITKEIISTIRDSALLLPFKSKGLLIGASECFPRERGRFTLTFNDREIEGILDGGHNSLAIALYILERAGVEDKDLRSIKVWADMKNIWIKNLSSIEKLRDDHDDISLNALVPVEILAPASISENTVKSFTTDIYEICQARNNNAELAASSVANQAGVFDSLKAVLPDKINNEVIWKTNENRRIKVRDLIAVAWIPLGVIDMPEGIKALPGNTAYSSKAEALKRYEDLIRHEKISAQTADGKSYEIINKAAQSALDLVPTTLKIYDLIYKEFKRGYNSTGGKFGRIDAVKNISLNKKGEVKIQHTPFFNEEFKNEIAPDGFIMPVAYSMRALIRKNKSDGTVRWAVDDPIEFFSDKENLKEIMQSIKGIFELANFDSQKVGKNEAAYTSALQQVRTLYLEQLDI